MIGRVNVGGGVGLKDTDAVLRVIAPAGSVVTISRGGVSKSDNGHENASDNTLYDYYFIIHQSQFSATAWTVTATLGTQSINDTIVIDSAYEYDVVLSYTLWLVKNGVAQDGAFIAVGKMPSSEVSGTPTAPSISSASNYIQIGLSASSGTGCGIAYLPNKYDLSKYTSARIIGTGQCAFDLQANLGFSAWTQIGTYQADYRLIREGIMSQNSSSYSSVDKTIDISSLTDVAYVGFNCTKASSQSTHIRIIDMYLEA